MTQRLRLSCVLGNILEHYDGALFGLLAPFIAPLFFHDQEPLTALILTYGIIPLGILTRPIGAIFFGKIGDSKGRQHALSLSLFGMSIVTVAIGLLPTSQEIGNAAPLFLALLRMLQSFFAAGESTGGAIFILEHTATEKRSFLSGLYDASTLVGISIASLLVTILSSLGTISHNWRYLFFAGAITAFFGLLLRFPTSQLIAETPRTSFSVKKALLDNRSALATIICCSGFSYTTYSLAFLFLNGYVPLITSISKEEMMQLNTTLLVLDMLLLPFFGFIAARCGKEKLMFTASCLACILAVPLFSCIQDCSLITVSLVRCTIVVLGTAFAAPYHAFVLEQVPKQQRYTVLALGHAIGSQLIGYPTSSLSMWLYKVTQQSFAPALYLIFTSLLASFAVFAVLRRRKNAIHAIVLKN